MSDLLCNRSGNPNCDTFGHPSLFIVYPQLTTDLIPTVLSSCLHWQGQYSTLIQSKEQQNPPPL